MKSDNWLLSYMDDLLGEAGHGNEEELSNAQEMQASDSEKAAVEKPQQQSFIEKHTAQETRRTVVEPEADVAESDKTDNITNDNIATGDIITENTQGESDENDLAQAHKETLTMACQASWPETVASSSATFPLDDIGEETVLSPNSSDHDSFTPELEPSPEPDPEPVPEPVPEPAPTPPPVMSQREQQAARSITPMEELNAEYLELLARKQRVEKLLRDSTLQAQSALTVAVPQQPDLVKEIIAPAPAPAVPLAPPKAAPPKVALAPKVKTVTPKIKTVAPAKPVEPAQTVTGVATQTAAADTTTGLNNQWQDGRPVWAQNRFDVLLFSVSQLTLAVPLVALGQIQKINDDLTPLFGQADWFMGVMPSKLGKIRCVDTALFVMRERYQPEFRQNYRFVITIDGFPWGLAVDEVKQPIALEPASVNWRGARSQRPWLAGTIREHMCALIDVPMLGEILAKEDKNCR
ncbi:chemotaxis protein CheW [Halioxenophilus aromaticivorans]|uniref:chemotaxis protein CheW n=1 Tax=Halioxenophilus aromaticivorans TaxID=1306992 RepID=UPI0036F3766C